MLIFLLIPLSLPVFSVCTTPHTTSSMVQQWWQKRDTNWNEGNVETTKVMSSVMDQSTVDESNYKKTYKELKTYALLQDDSKGSLSTDFTICSIIFTTRDYIHFPLILLGKDRDIFIEAFIMNTDGGLSNTSTVGLGINDVENHKDATLLPKVFPDQWVKSCVALSTESGSIKMFADGILRSSQHRL